MNIFNVNLKKHKSDYKGLEHFTLPLQMNNVIEHMSKTEESNNSNGYIFLVVYLAIIVLALYLANKYIQNYPMPQFAKLLVYSYSFFFNIPFIIIYAIFLRK